MQEGMKSMQQQLQLHTAQLEAQKRETRAAMETLAEAETEMESVHFEKKQLVAQWKSSLVAIQKWVGLVGWGGWGGWYGRMGRKGLQVDTLTKVETEWRSCTAGGCATEFGTGSYSGKVSF